MRDALFLSDVGERPEVGKTATVSGDGARHAVAVPRARPVRVSDEVLRTSTAGAVALSQINVLARKQGS